jgi:competence protein ComEA
MKEGEYMKFNKKYIVYIGVIAVLLVGVFSVNYLYQPNETINSDIALVDDITTGITNNEEDNYFYIDIKGCVKNPGVYKVNDQMIVNDAIKLSGGLTKNASTKNINLASKLKEGMVIYIYSKYELTNTTAVTTSITNDVYYSNDSDVQNTTSSISGKVNINTATKEQLMSISGVGESKAIAIIEYRNTNRFNTIEDIMNVSGIGESLFAKIKEYITV